MKQIQSLAVASALVALLASGAAQAEPRGFLETLHRNTTLTNTVPANGDQNPYAVVVAPVSAGTVKQGDVLVSNFNNAANLQGVRNMLDARGANGTPSLGDLQAALRGQPGAPTSSSSASTPAAPTTADPADVSSHP